MSSTRSHRPHRAARYGVLMAAVLVTGGWATASAAPMPAASGEPITVGIVTATSGPLSIYVPPYLDGLEAGLDYATDGTGEVNGRAVVFEIIDDGGEPERAISAATELIGDGVPIIAGTASSGVAIQMAPFAEENDILYISGAAAADAITGINRNTFRAGRQTYQDVAAAATLLDSVDGANVMVLAQDSAFGEGNVAAVEAVLGGAGANVEGLLVPMSTTEFTPNAQQVIDAAPDLLFVAWAGETTAALWQALTQQGVFEATAVTTGLGDVASYSAYGSDPTGIEFLSHYAPGIVDNPVNTAMADAVEHLDIFTPDGFVTSQMIVQALESAEPDDVEGMIAGLEGWTFDAPKGQQEIRASDHAMIQPMFTVTLEGEAGSYSPVLLETIDAASVAPPEL
jgi:branched-chain amino acid transport system substrate-binding protein